MDFNSLISNVRAKTTIEDSVDVLIGTLSLYLTEHSDDEKEIETLAVGLMSHIKALAAAVAENT